MITWSLFKSYISSPYVQLILGLGVAGCGVVELIDIMENDSDITQVGSHHGVILVGVLHTLKGINELLEGLEKW